MQVLQYKSTVLSKFVKKVYVFQPELAAGAGQDVADDQVEVAAEEEIVVWKGPVTPRPWESLGSELDVEDEKTVETRAKVSFNYLISKSSA